MRRPTTTDSPKARTTTDSPKAQTMTDSPKARTMTDSPKAQITTDSRLSSRFALPGKHLEKVIFCANTVMFGE